MHGGSFFTTESGVAAPLHMQEMDVDLNQRELHRDQEGFFRVRDTESGAEYKMRDLPSLFPNSTFVLVMPPGDPAVNSALSGGLDEAGEPLQLELGEELTEAVLAAAADAEPEPVVDGAGLAGDAEPDAASSAALAEAPNDAPINPRRARRSSRSAD